MIFLNKLHIPYCSYVISGNNDYSCNSGNFNSEIKRSSDIIFALILLPIAEAAESASVADLEMTHTASALPKLKDGPTVADDVQTPRGVFSGFIRKFIL